MKFKIKKRKRKKGKSGTEYEKVVAEVVRAFDSNAKVTQGQWVTGPDGRRELDVLIEGTGDGGQSKGIIECKDFNPGTTGPVGIAYVDALESKRRDLGAGFSFICSNAGFTSDAIRKAKRVRIGLISVMKQGDNRLRFAVIEEVYTRKIRIVSASFTLTGKEPITLSSVPFNEVRYGTTPVANWVFQRIPCLVVANPIVNGTFSATHTLSTPLVFEWPGGSAEATNFAFTFTIEGAWFSHRVEIDSTAGFYDWLRRRVRLAPMDRSQLEIKGIDVHKGEQISLPPDRELIREEFLKNEAEMKLVLFENYSPPESAPDLDKFIVPEDLDLVIPHLPTEASTSSSTFKPSQIT